MLLKTATDLQNECDALRDFVAPLSPEDWRRPTRFWNWSVWDEVVHLYYLDMCALASVTRPAEFQALVAEHRSAQAAGVEMSQRLQRDFAHLDKTGLLAAWTDQYGRMCAELATQDPGRRTAWFGPDMGVETLAIARQMEVWAHGQDIYDLFGVERQNADRIRSICDLGVRTYGWSFRNRGETPPAPPPVVLLEAPSGALWEWNAEGEGAVAGVADEFALVVTQRRNIADTGLKVKGPAAARWMQIAQCFAGPPSDGPPAGSHRPVQRAVRN